MSAKPTLKDIAQGIAAHLKRFENDPKINVRPTWESDGVLREGLQPYWHSHAWATGPRVFVCYVSFQGKHSLKREEAAAYLAWLDSGNVGTHWRAEEASK